MKKSLLLLAVVAVCCSKKPAEKPDTFAFEAGKKLARLDDDRIEEASGIAASAANKNMLWMHNDSGNPAEIFLVDHDARVRLTCELKGVENRDWEDIAIGPGPDETTSYIYVGEIGDNAGQHPLKMIYRFEEPKLDDYEDEPRVVITNFERFVFRLEDGAKDSEALLVHPHTKDIYIVSKREQPVVVYTLPYPQSTADTAVARAVARIPVTQIVGGDFSPDGREVLLKNYQNVFYWQVGDNEPLEETLKKPARILPYVEEPQGEAITFARDGSGYYTVSEKVTGEQSFLQWYSRTPRRQ